MQHILKPVLATGVLAASLATIAPAQAAVVFSQTSDGSYAGIATNRATSQNFLTSFTLTEATNINGFDIFSSLSGVQTGQAVTIKIRNSVSGAPAAVNLFSFQSTLSSISGSTLHTDFSNVLLAAGDYFFGVSGTSSSIGENIYSGGASPKIYQLSGDNIQFQTTYSSSFNVYGNAAAAAVPEMATWAMMIVGFGLAGYAMRRQKIATRVSYAA